jgi:hypothetical protein
MSIFMKIELEKTSNIKCNQYGFNGFWLKNVNRCMDRHSLHNMDLFYAYHA